MDVLSWFLQLYNFTITQTSKKTAYAKKFHFLYADQDGWDMLFKTDSATMLTFLMAGFNDDHDKTPRTPFLPDRRDNRRGRDRLPQRGRDNRANRDNNRAGGRDQSSRKRKADLPVCHSRTDKAATCTYARCKFSHDCGSCGLNHAAKDCPNWDQAKADRKKRN
jgi:hypothetical protein